MRKGRRGENGLSNQWIRLYPRIYNPLPERNEFPVFSCSPFLRRCFRSCLFPWNSGFEYLMELDGMAAGSACQRLATI